MKNKEFYKLLKKNKYSGFTLTELLVGLIMSVFVIGALGFGLMQMLRVTTKGDSETAARNETSRALDFISDEMRRAEFIEVDTSLSNINGSGGVSTSYRTLTKDDGSGGTTNIKPTLALKIPEVSEQIIYTVAPPQSNIWKGPLVIYRWGPPLDSNGNYTSGTWSSEALVDNLSDVSQTATCGVDADGNDITVTYQGFFACVLDDDGDSFTEDDITVDKNGDGKITAEDGADVDGKAITAQLYFTGGTSTGGGGTSTYSADTKTVARARSAPDNNSQNLSSYTMSFRSLQPSFSCNVSPEVNWEMRTDFGESLSNPGSLTNWNHEENRQPQPIKITGDTLVISSIPRGVSSGTTCLNNRANNGREATNPTDPRDYSGNKGLGESDAWRDNADVVAISHVIDFGDPTTFNGDIRDSCDDNSACGGSVKVNDGDSDTMNTSVMMLKRGSIVPDYGGYDANGNGDRTETGDQPSLGEFLASKGLAENIGTDSSPEYKIISVQETGEPTILGDDERIIAFEIGYEVSSADTTPSDTTSPGIDFQDNIFVVQSNKFKEEKFDSYSVP